MRKNKSHLFTYFIALVIIATLFGCRSIKKQDAESLVYLMTYFKDNDHSLHFALSADGYTFTDINNGKAVIGGDTIASQKGIRDPHITKGPDGAFYIVMTDLHIFGKEKGHRETQWERPVDKYDWGNNKGFVMMKSEDLIHWTHSNFIFNDTFESLKEMGCAWAPQTIYDPKEDKMMVYFTMRIGHGLTKMYYAYANDDFTKIITEPKILFDYPNEKVQVLDADITQIPDGRYCMTYVAQERPGGIKIAFSDEINKGYKYDPKWIDFEPGSCEAPNMWKQNGTDKWVLMYDIFSVHPHNFGFVETTDFINFKNLGHFNEGVMKTTNFTSPKHGAVISISKKQALKLAKHWGMNFSINK
ncbi:glycoside hydrolase family 43 protein [Wenyingzhuangia sp. IMCC45467]